MTWVTLIVVAVFAVFLGGCVVALFAADTVEQLEAENRALRHTVDLLEHRYGSRP